MPFSVLMSLYAKEKPEYFWESLNSIFNQTHKADEVILVEDGPLTTELYDIIKEFQKFHPELHTLSLPYNSGLGKALNEGLKYCSYDIVARMDTDDIAKNNRFEKQIEFMESHPEIDICSSWVDEFIGDTSNVISVKKVPQYHEEIYKFGKTRSPLNHPAVMFRKKSVIDSGGYGPFPEDYYLWGRMLVKGYKMYNFQESFVFFRISKDVFKRRGGWSYYKQILKLQKELKNISYISYTEYLKNIIYRTVVTLMPNSIRAFIYNKFLRSKNKHHFIPN